mmetsp:Transcript_7660/g.15528  ORF Transcript_7660/g.15528 Transcript_7660/m.15528 type:complete len:173 (-) Transcript_7660:52-570(-)|eukprot:CAMPEP_0184678502 /NCGR_PEP_ID=MMETSP0312-20130426/1245_1 /TAXON_ID=31354 /ORGANISM="Compsopogon coeruleus, Strain SAG 36.94" /LENGTH=172 /DNA_ID=CAMNT_0027127293 /DNA_START=137 /DNA_END=655 /DNA_ORIENTATION=+
MIGFVVSGLLVGGSVGRVEGAISRRGLRGNGRSVVRMEDSGEELRGFDLLREDVLGRMPKSFGIGRQDYSAVAQPQPGEYGGRIPRKMEEPKAPIRAPEDKNLGKEYAELPDYLKKVAQTSSKFNTGKSSMTSSIPTPKPPVTRTTPPPSASDNLPDYLKPLADDLKKQGKM